MRNLQQYLSMEDFEEEAPVVVEEPALETEVAQDLEAAEVVIPEVAEEPVTEEALEMAEEEAEDLEVEAAEDHAEYEGAVGASDEVEELVSSVEHYATVLAHGIKTKTYSTQAVANAQHQLDRLKSVFGESAVPTPSLESYGKDDLEGFYTASLESFRGFAKRLTDVNVRIGNSIGNYFAKGTLVNGYKKRAGAIVTAADAALQKANTLKGSEKVSVSVSDRRLSGAGAELFPGLNADLKSLTAAVTKGLPANETFLKAVTDVLVEATTSGGVGKTGAIVAKAAQIKPAVDAYPAEAFTGMIGGRKLTRGSEGAGEGTRSAIKALRTNAIPGVETKKGEKGSGETSFSKADGVKILQLSKTYAALAQKAAQQTGEEAFGKLTHVKGTVARTYGGGADLRDGAEATSWAEGKDLDALATALPKFAQNHITVYRFLNEHALSVAAALESLGSKIIKKLESAEPKGE